MTVLFRAQPLVLALGLCEGRIANRDDLVKIQNTAQSETEQQLIERIHEPAIFGNRIDRVGIRALARPRND